jgi:hypothetical protein
MNLVRRAGSRAVVIQVPVVLLLVTALFSLPPIGVALYQLSRGIDTGGSIFALLFGVLMLWLFLEFVATRERFEVDLAARRLELTARGLFRTRRRSIQLAPGSVLEMEERIDPRGTKRIRRQYLYLSGPAGRELMNEPAKVYMNQERLGQLLSEVLGVPYRGLVRTGTVHP